MDQFAWIIGRSEAKRRCSARFVVLNEVKNHGNWAFIGNEFLKQNNALALKVPSAVVDEEYNFLFNPNHKDYKKLKITAIKKFKFDKRLFLTNE